tara:strand:- start:117 stop:338 length:222 start_codon:yes stop_codon:yes gene_type:complete
MDIFDNRIEDLLIDLNVFIRNMSSHLDINHSIWAVRRGENLIRDVRTELVKKELHSVLTSLPNEIIDEIISFL